MKPTLKEKTAYRTADILPVHVSTLQNGQQEPSLAAARSYVQRLVTEKQVATQPAAGVPSSPTTVARAPAPTT
jgi:site-specific recombinase XerC